MRDENPYATKIIYSVWDYNVEEYGIIVIKGSRTGLLLPGLDGVATSNEQLQIVPGKAGIRPEEDYTVKRFQVQQYPKKTRND